MSKRILVTGATGVTASYGVSVFQQLVDAGIEFRVLVRNPEKLPTKPHSKVDVVKGDMNDEVVLRKAMKDIQTLFLLTPMSPAQAQMEGRVIEEAKRAGVEHVVKLSAIRADEQEIDACRWHFAAEQVLKASGLKWTMIRPMPSMGFITSFAPMIKQTGGLFLPAGNGKAAFSHPRDVADVIIEAIMNNSGKHDNKVIEVAGPESFSFGDAMEKLGAMLGRSINYVSIPDEDFKKGMSATGAPEVMQNAYLGFFKAVENGTFDYTQNNLKSITGNNPRSFDEWLKESANLFK
jgi:uncharacterized protein YbjT (DUF2867 family)